MRNGGRNKVNPDEMAHNEHWRQRKLMQMRWIRMKTGGGGGNTTKSTDDL